MPLKIIMVETGESRTPRPMRISQNLLQVSQLFIWLQRPQLAESAGASRYFFHPPYRRERMAPRLNVTQIPVRRGGTGLDAPAI